MYLLPCTDLEENHSVLWHRSVFYAWMIFCVALFLCFTPSLVTQAFLHTSNNEAPRFVWAFRFPLIQFINQFVRNTNYLTTFSSLFKGTVMEKNCGKGKKGIAEQKTLIRKSELTSKYFESKNGGVWYWTCHFHIWLKVHIY